MHWFNVVFEVAKQPPAWAVFLIGGVILLIIYGLISMVETIVFQMLRWGSFRQAALASFTMNLASSVVCLGLVVLVPRPEIWGLLVAWGISVLIEGGVLMMLRRGASRQNWIVVLLANTATYVILILPAYLYAGNK